MPIFPCWITKSLLLAGLAASSCDALAVPRAVSSTVKTSKGSVSGYAGYDYNRYVVPYAQAPTGARRFADPVAPAAFKTYDAAGLPLACPTAYTSGALIGQYRSEGTSEDCLFATIYTPKGATTASKLPVFFWVHGGSFWSGNTTDKALDGAELATAQNMVVVTVQYRLGALGFLKNDALGISGNFGLKDIIMALNYVKTEISAFGGDADRVTVAGQSSGAELVKSLFVTPSATSLFARAILHSASLDYFDESVAAGNTVGQKFASDIKCTTLACLRSASINDIVDSQMNTIDLGNTGRLEPSIRQTETGVFKTVVDGQLVTRDFRDVVANGQALEGGSKPIIFTTVKQEAATAIYQLGATVNAQFGAPLDTPIDPYFFDDLVNGAYGNRAKAIIASRLYDPALYPGDDSVREAFVDLGTDFNWVCANQQTAIKLASAGRAVYQAQFDSGIKYQKNNITFSDSRVDHQDDIRLVFNPTGNLNLTRAQRQTLKEVQARWAAFAATGSPNAAGYGTWSPVVSSSQLNLLRLGNGSQGQSVFEATQRSEQCAAYVPF